MQRINFKLQFDDLWALIGLLGIIAILNLAPILPNDYWFHVAYGRDILNNHAIPFIDNYSFTMSGTVYDSVGIYWLAEVFMQLIRSLSGTWETFFYGLIICASYLLTYQTVRLREKNKFAAGFALLIAILLGVTNWNIRPQIFAYFYLSVIQWSLAKLRITTTDNVKQDFHLTISHWFLVIASLILWQNSHGTFLFGYLIVGLWVLDFLRGKQRLFLVLIFGILPLFTPLGYSIIEYFLKMFSNAMASRNITEWQPASIYKLTGQIFFPTLILILLLGTQRPKLRISEWISLIAFLVLGLRYQRAIIFFGFYAAQFIAVEFGKLKFFMRERQENSLTQRLTFLIAGTVVLLTFFTLPFIKPFLPIEESRKTSSSVNTPIQAVDVLTKQSPIGNVFTHFSYASYLTYQTNAATKIFMDTRFELYSDQVFEDFLIINAAKTGWEDVASKYKIDHWLLSKEKQPDLINALNSLEFYDLIYEDNEFILFSIKQP